jgi:hypothetical protein
VVLVKQYRHAVRNLVIEIPLVKRFRRRRRPPSYSSLARVA